MGEDQGRLRAIVVDDEAFIRQVLSRILDRLGVEHLDVLLLHRPDYLLDPDDVASAFERLSAAGKVTHFGVSNFSPAQVRLLAAAVDRPLAAHQFELNLENIAALDDGTLDQCRELGMTPQAWSPLAGPVYRGWTRPLSDAALRRLRAELDAQASAYGVEDWHVILAWLLRHPAGIAPIIGSTSPQRIRDAARALDIDYARTDWYRLLEARPMAVIDVHNNTGLNPHYAAVNRIRSDYLRLASMFSSKVVYFTIPTGTLSHSMSEFCPSVTLECGQAGEVHGTDHSLAYIETCLHQESISLQPVNADAVHLFHMVATVNVNPDVLFGFGRVPADEAMERKLRPGRLKGIPAHQRRAIRRERRRDEARQPIGTGSALEGDDDVPVGEPSHPDRALACRVQPAAVLGVNRAHNAIDRRRPARAAHNRRELIRRRRKNYSAPNLSPGR